MKHQVKRDRNCWMIIADDLTGAMDTGVHFANRGVRTIVIPDVDKERLMENDWEKSSVWVLNTESRHADAKWAAEQVMACVRAGQTAGFSHFYKKTDSTLRGNIGAELHAFLSLLSTPKLPFIPAYPAMDRYTREGFHFVGDLPVHRSDFANDPLSPVLASYIPELLRPHTNYGIRVLHSTDKFETDNRKEILVFDCHEERDLEAIRNFLVNHQMDHAVAGSAGIASRLGESMELPKDPFRNDPAASPILIVNGSLNPVSLEQVKVAEERGIPGYYLKPGALTPDPELDPEHLTSLQKTFQEVQTLLEMKRNVMISTIKSRKDFDRYVKEIHPNGIPLQVFRQAAQRFGSLLVGLIRNSGVDTVVLFGGDTLMALIRALKIRELKPVREIQPGIVMSSADMKEGRLTLITKPGGYGNEQALVRIIKQINTI